MSVVNVLLGVTGSVATIKLLELIDKLKSSFEAKQLKCEIRVVFTSKSKHFCDPTALPSNVQSFTDEDEWGHWKQKGDPVVHIDLRRWADVFVVAPLSANTLAKLANGLSDNLLTCVARAWDVQKPFIVFPAMNTLMWEHAFTSRHIATIVELGTVVVPPVSKELACGDTGVGALPPVDDVAKKVVEAARGELG
uniref:Flavoprotein domain-containing protein n=1 Tax=Chromera velia CCMP2878 TaxID=1169474 RepID=A0A0G4I9D1_9ALVE|mmetsp:Transcript_22533/g.44614  ORF Transcript_22533/g.44614 Transcript_22533/m.44614 type:complete len:194 (+) Transcript_22533:241-822(+)|eukprot:Cvel_12229.t1-p1 / transcript=Cvel_12229.t1 / gene=Cvel_12229 / organism=Chromera_velia_CCMP2878 / gene_product=Phosphopantothenoylcysteine decarboxylase, putative / transcript_product=Phosphopantothenoylcysteine decarboxylase, putative / location=Cvel_scaffold791:63775-64353(-) / protein_length=193 / sequence_SO=supercontig / SO=protein_coding / is_pseudo=false